MKREREGGRRTNKRKGRTKEGVGRIKREREG